MSITTTLSEYESGTYTGHVHPHNGYYAGNFGPRATRSTTRSASKARVTAAHKTLADIGLMRVAGDDQSDCRIEPVEDRQDVA